MCKCCEKGDAILFREWTDHHGMQCFEEVVVEQDENTVETFIRTTTSTFAANNVTKFPATYCPVCGKKL